jgi:hypothetical protein
MKTKYTTRIHIKIDGEYHLWETLSPEKQKEIGIAINDRALRAIGYVPVTKEKTV